MTVPGLLLCAVHCVHGLLIFLSQNSMPMACLNIDYVGKSKNSPELVGQTEGRILVGRLSPGEASLSVETAREGGHRVHPRKLE